MAVVQFKDAYNKKVGDLKYLLIEKKVLNEESLKNGLLAVKFICSLL